MHNRQVIEMWLVAQIEAQERSPVLVARRDLPGMRCHGLDIAGAVVGESQQQVDAGALRGGDQRVQFGPIALRKLILQRVRDKSADGVRAGLPRQAEIGFDQRGVELAGMN